jgi:L-2-hydroxyglutarate oxidase
MVKFCEAHEVPFEICGKLVVATNEQENGRLGKLHERGIANGLQGIRYLDRDEMRKREPHVGGIAALEVPEEGIVDYPAVCEVLSQEIVQNGGAVHCASLVKGLTRKGNSWRIHTDNGEYFSDYIINCAGLHSDRVSSFSGLKPKAKIVPFRGEYYQL